MWPGNSEDQARKSYVILATIIPGYFESGTNQVVLRNTMWWVYICQKNMLPRLSFKVANERATELVQKRTKTG